MLHDILCRNSGRHLHPWVEVCVQSGQEAHTFSDRVTMDDVSERPDQLLPRHGYGNIMQGTRHGATVCDHECGAVDLGRVVLLVQYHHVAKVRELDLGRQFGALDACGP